MSEPLVGIVVVSHSARVAEGVVEIAAQMAPDVRIVPAGGAADGSLGEDATRIAGAIEEADAGAGVVVVMDFNGAVTTARAVLQLELIDAGLASRVRLSGGPLVEGAVFGAAQAGIGDDLEAVLATTEAAAGYDKHVAD
jgi:PTS hybrid protein